MMGWYVAGILYALPVALIVRDQQRGIDTEMNMKTVLAWPGLMLIELLWGGRE